MLTLLSKVRTWRALHEETAATMVEYALLVVLVAVAALIAVAFVGEQVSNTFSDIGGVLANP